MPDLAFERFDAPTPPAYCRSLANALERREPIVWRWTADRSQARRASDAARLALEKRAEPLKRDEHVDAYAAAEQIAAAVGAANEVRLWRWDAAARRNVALYFEPDIAHVAFEGDALAALDPAELRWALGHELAHHKLWTLEGARNWTAHRMLSDAQRVAAAAPAVFETGRLLKLTSEVYADRVGLWAVGDLDPALRALAKLDLGLDEPSASAILADAEAALADLEARRASVGADDAQPWIGGASHPVAQIRAALLAAWAHGPAQADARSRALLENGQPLDGLDLLGQERVADLTHWMLAEFLTEPWRRRRLILDHAATISSTLAEELRGPELGERDDLGRLRTAVAGAHPSVRRYFAYLLLDFATVDPQLDHVMLAAALRFAGDFGLIDDFKRVAATELKTTRAKLGEIEKDALQIMARAALALEAGPDASAAASGGRA